MMHSWKNLEGVTLADKFQLQSFVSESGPTACFLTRVAGHSPSWGWLRLALPDDTAIERQLSRWQTAAGLSHPNLMQVWESGRAERGDTSMAYLLTEPADETLAGVLAERSLDQLEAREALLSVAKALSYLHSRALVHGNVEPSAIFAVGESIKLSADTIQPAAESADDALTPAGDLRALGQCIHAMFTQTLDTDPEHLSAVPQPFRDIVRGCYGLDPNEKWTAQRVVAALNWPPVPAVSPVEHTPRELAARPPLPQHAPDAPRDRKRFPAWTLALACATALLIVLLARKPQPAYSRATLPPAGSRIVSAPQPAAPTPLGATPAAIARSRATPAPTVKSAPAESIAQARIWRVISYTYSKGEDAARMVGDINRKFPHLRAERFFPNGSNPPYFVALGGRMTRSEAVRVREQAISSGFPSDTFVRNFKR